MRFLFFPARFLRPVLILLVLACSPAAAKTLLLPRNNLAPGELAVIVNDSDRLSQRIAAYYQKRRDIPEKNIIHVRFRPNQRGLAKRTFERLYKIVKAKTPGDVQAYLLTWARPYRVGCMSITMAFATGYAESYCPRKIPDRPCGITKRSPYFASFSRHPAQDFRLRPSMLLAAMDFADAKRLIDRGVRSDASLPRGRAYLLSTSDRARNVRAAEFPADKKALHTLIPIEVLKRNFIRGRRDVMFYFTGEARVPYLNTLGFLPGAVADHLTSSGGQMKARGGPGQMSSLRWLEAGATGSYGTVFEPCNFRAKFPDPGVMMYFYLRGESLIEAYWKSVARPSEGLFIGEPLAKPFALGRIEFKGNAVDLPLNRLSPGRYTLEAAHYPVGPYTPTGRTITVRKAIGERPLEGLVGNYYRLRRVALPRNGRMPNGAFLAPMH